MKISDENVKSRQYEPTKAYIIGLSNISKEKKRGVGTLLYLLKKITCMQDTNSQGRQK
jgi:hypothetical protein